MRIGREFWFSSSHHLPRHQGKCQQMHGHNYKLVVEVEGQLVDETLKADYGMVMDFKELDKVVSEGVIERFDHKHLNDDPDLEYPTAECLVQLIWTVLQGRLEGEYKDYYLKRVELWENHRSYAYLEA